MVRGPGRGCGVQCHGELGNRELRLQSLNSLVIQDLQLFFLSVLGLAQFYFPSVLGILW